VARLTSRSRRTAPPPLNSSVRPMRNLSAVVFLYFLCLTHVQASSAPVSLTGLWQFGQHTVWVQINRDGSAYQCRIAPGGTVYSSRGTFAAPSSIHWSKIWGVDKVSLRAGALVVKDRHGSFRYHATSQPMEAACLASWLRSNISSKRTREKPRAA
jgi:hypothetical protein